MSAAHRFRPLLSCGLVAIASVAAARAQGPATAAEEEQKRLDRRFRESLGWYQVTADPGSGATMKPQPVLRWTNHTRGQEGEPTLILWTDAGRPEALASVYTWQGNLIYECVSLARGEGLTAREGGRIIWSPAEVGVTFRDIPDAPDPAEAPAARLRQMRSLAERFRVTMTGLKADLSDREEMRLLSRPIYRYEPTDAPAAPAGPIDGAVFAFVQGTDPEAVLLLEAVRRGDPMVWQYAFGRATEAGLEARLGPSVVWTTARVTHWTDPKLTFIGLGRPLVE